MPFAGYSVAPFNYQTISLERSKYVTFEEASKRVAEILEHRGMHLVGMPFYTARCWVFWGKP